MWRALTDADLTARYWGHRNESDWQPGSTWQHLRTDGSGIADVTGTVLESVRPERLVITFPGSAEQREDPSQVTFTIEPHEDIVRLTVRHDGLPTESDYQAISAGWPAVMANLKSLLETGEVLPQAPWEMPQRADVLRRFVQVSSRDRSPRSADGDDDLAAHVPAGDQPLRRRRSAPAGTPSRSAPAAGRRRPCRPSSSRSWGSGRTNT